MGLDGSWIIDLLDRVDSSDSAAGFNFKSELEVGILIREWNVRFMRCKEVFVTTEGMSGVASGVFDIDGVQFVMDIRNGKDRGKSEGDKFILVKTPAFLNFYRGLQSRRFANILEIGMFEGGSLVLFDKMFKPDRLVGVDIRVEPIVPLENYRKGKEHIHTYYGLSQDDERLSAVLGERFPDGIDLIVDDASHLYEQSRKTFHLCFPHLKPSGLYVLEDWSWSHKPPHQLARHPWYKRNALTNLVMEFMVNLPRSEQIDMVSVHRDLVVVHKAARASGPINLDEGRAHLRGRDMSLL